MATGTITQIIGPVVDVRFDAGLPAIKNALHVPIRKSSTSNGAGKHEVLTLEVVQHLGLNRARCIAMQDTAGLARETEVVDTGAAISVPVGEIALGRMFNVVGDPIDGIADVPKGSEAFAHSSGPARIHTPVDQGGIVRDGHQSGGPSRALHQRRQSRPLRRRRRRQDRTHSGTHPQCRERARRLLGVRGSRGARPRRQRPLPRNERFGRARQDRARLRSDERSAGCPRTRRALGPHHGRSFSR